MSQNCSFWLDHQDYPPQLSAPVPSQSYEMILYKGGMVPPFVHKILTFILFFLEGESE